MTELNEDPELVRQLAEVSVRLHDEKSHNLADKGNFLLIGSARCGKTTLTREAAEYLEIPFGYCECRRDLEKGCNVDIVEDVLADLYSKTGESIPKAEMGIVLLNEIDKLRISEDDPRGLRVQEELFRMLDGSIVRFPFFNRSQNRIDRMFINTSEILFIGAGAFDRLEDIVRQRLRVEFLVEGKTYPPKKANGQDDSWFNYVRACDLVKYGLLPELIGHFQTIVPMDPLNQAWFIGVLTEWKDSLIDTWQQHYMRKGIKLTFDDNAIPELAKMATSMEKGVDGLNNLLFHVIDGVESESRKPVKRICVTRDAVVHGFLSVRL